MSFNNQFSIANFIDNPLFFKHCKKFINPWILKRAISGYEILTAEHREVTCILLRFDGTNYSENLEESVNNLNDYYHFVQKEADRYGGILLAPDISDKGNVFVILLGAPVALERKELLGIQLALSLSKEREHFPFINKIQCGISTGRAYCGDFGTAIRKDYSIVGNVINLAARLMTYSEESGLYCDERTQKRVHSGYKFEKLGNVNLKGINSSINIFKLLKIKDSIQYKVTNTAGLKIVGRNKELNYLGKQFHAATNNKGSCCGIIADAGVGKSLLLNTFLSKFDSDQVLILTGRCFTYEKRTLYYMWREFFFNLFNIPNKSSSNEIKQIVEKKFLEILSISEIIWVPLLLKMIGIDIDESSDTLSIDPEQKQKRLFETIVKLLISLSTQKPIIISFEDIHWTDEKSFTLFEYIIAKISNEQIFIIYTSRNEDGLILLKKLNHFNTLKVKNLEKEDAIEFIRSILKLKSPNKKLEEQIISASECNPFFIDTIIKGIKDNDKVICDETGTFFINGDIKDIEIPNSIKSVILSRIDLLDSTEQVIIKTASVIGHNFSYVILLNMLKKELSETTDIDRSLNLLESHDLMNIESTEPLSYMFKHMSIRDVVYQTLLQGTKSKLNLLLAKYLEENANGNIYGFSERLALHYNHGQNFKKALEYTLISAKKAKNLYAYNDSINHFEKALGICSKLEKKEGNKNCPIFDIKINMIQTHRISGHYSEALKICREFDASKHTNFNIALVYKEKGFIFQELGNIKESIDACEDALHYLNQRIPNKLFNIYIIILWQLIIRGIMDSIIFKFVKYNPKKKHKFLLEIKIFSILNKIYFFDKLEKNAWCTILKYNLSEIVNNPTSLSISAADFGITMVSLGLKKYGLRHINRSINIANETKDLKNIAFCLSRKAVYYLFFDDPHKSIKTLEESIEIIRSIGGMWELMTSLGTLGQNYFNISEYKKSIEAYNEVGSIAKEIYSQTHQGWMYCKVPFIKYISNDMEYDDAVEEMSEAIKISTSSRDLMNLCIVYGHLAEMARLDNRPDRVAEYIQKIVYFNKKYSADIPHIRISLINACVGALYLIDINYVGLTKKALLKIANQSLKKVYSLAKNNNYLLGPALRAHSMYELTKGREKKSKKLCIEALNILKPSLYKRQYALTLKHAAICFKEEKDRYLALVDSLFTDMKL